MEDDKFPIKKELLISSLIILPLGLVVLFFSTIVYLYKWLLKRTGFYTFSAVFSLLLAPIMMFVFLFLILTNKWSDKESEYLRIKEEKKVLLQPPSEERIKKREVRNACVVLKVGESFDRIILVRDSNDKKWMFPGGKIERGETPFQAMVREFKEETGFILPTISSNSEPYIYDEETAVFIGASSERFPAYDKENIKDFETDRLEYAKIEDIFKGKYLLKNYTANTMIELKKQGLV